jgi:hypothetical protein
MGWNPADALTFPGDEDTYWRCYRACNSQDWFSVEIRRHVHEDKDLSDRSGYQVHGWRGCVRSIALRSVVNVNEIADYSETFLNLAARIVSRAAPGADSGQLLQAISQKTSFSGIVGRMHTSFELYYLPTDRGERPQAQFTLTCAHP